MPFYAKFDMKTVVPRWMIFIGLLLIGFLRNTPVDASEPCPEGEKCAPVRPTLAQCSERISLETGDTTYKDLLEEPTRWVPLERAKAIADHPLCYGGRVPFLNAKAIDPGPGGWTRAVPAVISYRRSTITALSFETVAVHNKVLAFLKHESESGFVVDAHTPPALYPVTAEVQDYEFWALTKKGPRSYLDWKSRLGVQVWLPFDDLFSGPPTAAPPAIGIGFAYRWNSDLAFGIGAGFADCGAPGAGTSCKYVSLYGGVSWQLSLRRFLGGLW